MAFSTDLKLLKDLSKEELTEFARASVRCQLSEHLLDCIEKIRSRFPPGPIVQRALSHAWPVPT